MTQENQSIDYEKLLISAVLNDADALRIVVGGYSKKGIPPTDPQSDSFADERHRLLWRCFQDLLVQRQQWDGFQARVPIREWLEQRDKWETVGDDYLTELYYYAEEQGQLSTSDVWKWAQRVRDNARKRDLAREGKRLVTRAEDPSMSADDAIGETVQSLVRMKLGRSQGFTPLSSHNDKIEETFDVWLRGVASPRVRTGFLSLDRMLGGGLGLGQLTVLGGRPGSFKTAWAWMVARNVADNLVKSDAGGIVAFVSLEMLSRDLIDRALCVEAEIDMTEANRHKYVGDAHAEARLTNAAEYLKSLPILIDDEHGLTSAMIYHRIMGLQGVDDVRLVIIDYAEQIGDKGRDEEQRVSGIFTAAKGLAKDLNIPVILLTQLNREVERTATKIPELHHIRMGGQAEAVADNVLFTYHPGKYKSLSPAVVPSWVHRKDNEIDPTWFYLIIAKSRYGATDRVSLRIEPKYTKIYDDISLTRTDEDF